MSDREALFAALSALRDAASRGAPAPGEAWQVVSRFVGTRLRRPAREHDEIVQRTLLKVFKGVGHMEADVPAAAEAWLRQVHRSATFEHHRRQDPVEEGLSRTPRDESAPSPIDRLVAPEEERTAAHLAALDRALDWVLEQVERWLEANVPRSTKRAGDRLRAQAALLANVVGMEADEIRARLGLELSRDTIYKWIERGRETVVLPALLACEAEGDPEGARLAVALRELLEGARRADAGKPRPARRTVSRGSAWTSIQSKPPGGERGRGS